MRKLLITCIASLAWTDAMAVEPIVGRVTFMEATYLPGAVNFSLDGGSATCPAGRTLWWQKADQSSNKAIYATLLMAIATTKRVRVYVNEGDVNCFVQFFHVLPD